MKKCEHCNKRLGKECILIVPPKIEIDLGVSKIEEICLKCAKKEGRKTT